MIKNPFAKFDFSNPFGTRRSRNLFGSHTTPREWKHGARDIPFGMGAMSLYVDGTDGHDSNDGESWKTAVKTIQEAVDRADSWTNIFIKSGTYAESVTIATDSISLVGQSRDSVEIKPPTGTALTISNSNFRAVSLSTVSNVASAYSTIVNGRYCILQDFGIVATLANARGIYANASNCDLNGIYIDDVLMNFSVIFASGIHDTELRNSYLKPTGAFAYAVGLAGGANRVRIHDNTIEGCLKGVDNQIDANVNIIYHNNFISVANPIDGPNNTFFENFYDDHTTDTNNDGLCDSVYTGGGATDYTPISRRDGWKQISLGYDIAGRSISKLQMAATTINLNQAAATYTLLTGTTQAVLLEKLAFRMPNVDISGGSLTSILIQTDDATPAVIISAADGVLANLTQEASLTWTGSLLIPAGTLIRLTIAGGASGTACTCDVVAESRAVVNSGYLA